MALDIDKGRGIQARVRIGKMLSKPDEDEDPGKAKAKREKLLALLKSQYGYTNEKAVDELARLLKLFSRTNKSSGIRHIRPKIKHTLAE
jgi:hypothetical protein